MIMTGSVGQPGQSNAPGSHPQIRQGAFADVIVSELNGRYYEAAYRGNVFWAGALVTAPVIFSTAAGSGGPFIWNQSLTKNLVLLKMTCAIAVVSTVAGALGIGLGTSTAPSSITVPDACFAANNPGVLLTGTTNAVVGRIATPSAAAVNFFPVFSINTGALTVAAGLQMTYEFDGGIIVPPGSFATICSSATLSTLQAKLGLCWMEVPI